MSPAIEVDRIFKRFGGLHALSGMMIGQGEFFGLLGPNGAGKTTLISIIAGLTRATSGTMRALSGGVKRRVLVAQALVHKPPVIVLDEPTPRCRRRAETGTLALHPAAQSRRTRDRPDDALSGGS